MKERLFENRIANVRDGVAEYQTVVFKNSCAGYEVGRCYLLTRDELELLATPANEQPYIIDRSLQGLVDKVRREQKTVFSREELESILGVCWVTQESLLNLHDPVLVDDGNICEKDDIMLCQDHRGGFVASTPLLDSTKRLSYLLPHSILPLIKSGTDLIKIDQTILPVVTVIKIVTFMNFVDEMIKRKMQEIAPEHQGLIHFHTLIREKIYENLPRIIHGKEDQLEFFSSPEFQKIWNDWRRMFILIKQYKGCTVYVNCLDFIVLPLLVTLMCPVVSSVALQFGLKVGAGFGVVLTTPVRKMVNFVISPRFFHPDLRDDGLDLTPFLEAMRKNIRETRGSDHPHSA